AAGLRYSDRGSALGIPAGCPDSSDRPHVQRLIQRRGWARGGGRPRGIHSENSKFNPRVRTQLEDSLLRADVIQASEHGGLNGGTLLAERCGVGADRAVAAAWSAWGSSGL